MSALDRFATQKLEALEAKSLKRTLVITNRGKMSSAERVIGEDRHSYISFCCNDYLNLSQHPAVIEASISALKKFGTGAGASRHITGNHELYTELESKLAAIKGTDDAVVFGSGYLANLGGIPTLVGAGDLVVVDELAHACIHGGAQLSRAALHIFRHNDMAHLQEILKAERAKAQHALIITDGVFSMDGDLAPLDDLVPLADEFDAWLMTDDAHGLGVIGEGRGSSFKKVVETGDLSQKYDVPLQMGTLSKAVGSYGGYICASQPVIDFIKTRARSLIYSTGLPPATVAASIAAVDIIANNRYLCAEPVRKARIFSKAVGLNEVPESCIIPIVLNDPNVTLKASQLLQEHGFLVTAIRPPTVPEGTARLRLTFCADHREEDILRLAKIIRDEILLQS